MRVLRTFVAAAQRQSFSAAAKQLFLTSSAVSHQIKHLESELGRKLFDRNPRSLSLTEHGTALLDDLQPILGQLDEVIETHTVEKSREPLRVSVQPFFASELFVPRLNDFVTVHPEIDISIDTADEAIEKHPNSADVSLRIFKTPPTQIACDRLFPLCLTPAGSPDFYDSIKVIAGRIVSEFPLLMHETRSSAWAEWSKVARITLPKDAPVVKFGSMAAVARAAEQGMGAALVPIDLSQNWFDAGSLVQLFDRTLNTGEAYYLVSRHGDRDKPAVRALRKWVLDTFVKRG